MCNVNREECINDNMRTKALVFLLVLAYCSVSSVATLRQISGLVPTVAVLTNRWTFVRVVDISSEESPMEEILTRHLAVPTCVVIYLACGNASRVLVEASSYGYFNKSYEWLLMDTDNAGLKKITKETRTIGLNAQVTYANSSQPETLDFFDLHSKGQHLGSPLVVTHYGKWSVRQGFGMRLPLEHIRNVQYRRHFQGVTLRGVVVIDREDVNPAQIDKVMTSPSKIVGVSPFSKYHYSMVNILQQYFNFTINYRITHGWAGRLADTQFRVGLLGVVQRDEADIAASAAFDRINRFAEFDTIHQSWKFQAAFLYRITSELKDSQGGGGNFLTPFDRMVWLMACVSLAVFIALWEFCILVEKCRVLPKSWFEAGGSVISSIGVICQQGLTETPGHITTRMIAYVLLIFSLLMYNFYTSSVVGGLLSTQAKGPQNLTELVDSPLTLSFEDIGYHKVIFKETNSSFLKDMYYSRVQPPRHAHMLPAYTTVKEAIPYLKTGRYAFHCEMIDAYPDIAKHFDPNEICDLRSVSGLFDVQIMNMIVTKRSAYTEMFRIALHRAREVGLINHEMRTHRPETPRCLSGFTVHPVTLNGVRNAFIILIVAAVTSGMLLLVEIWAKWIADKKCVSTGSDFRKCGANN